MHSGAKMPLFCVSLKLKTSPAVLAGASACALLWPAMSLADSKLDGAALLVADAAPTLKMEQPVVDTSTPKAPPAAPAAPRQSTSGYFVPPEVMTSGAPQYSPGQPQSGGYGNPPMQSGAPPAFPSENAIPEFGKPLPAVQSTMNSTYQGGPGWGTGPTQSNDEARVGRLEKSVLGSMYPEHDLDDRVEHLEEELYKIKGSGPIDARLRKMETSVFGQSAAFGAASVAPLPVSAPARGGSTPGPVATQTPSHAPYEMTPYPQQRPASPAGAYTASSPGSGAPPSSAPGPNNIYGTSNGYPPPGSYGAQGGYVPSGSSPANGAPGAPGPYGSVNAAPTGNYRPPYNAQPNRYPAQYGGPQQSAPYPPQQPGGYNPNYGAQAPSSYPPNGGGMTRPGPGYASQPNALPPGYPPQANQYPTGGAPYAPPSGGYGVPGQYPGSSGGGYSSQIPSGMPFGITTPTTFTPDAESQKVLNSINSDPRAGDYYSTIRKFQTGNVARWQHFPVLIHLPPNTPELWHKNLIEDVKKWSIYIPMRTAADYESFVIDVKWENKLPPGIFGITRVEGSGAGLKVIIFLLRPTFYPADVPEPTLQAVFLHELGHAIGLYGHSENKADVMYLDEKVSKKVPPAVNTISQRDLNTLKRIYLTQPISDSFLIQPPLEYNFSK
jgi:predicted Zn-dependent protease